MPNMLEMLKEDHLKVKTLLEEFEQAEDNEEKQDLAKKITQELKIHAQLEEEIFYPAMRQAGEEEATEEAEQEHHVAKLLIAEIERLGPEDEGFDAKVKVLGELVKHHIEEEESEMFPKIESSDADLDALGEQMLRQKERLSQSRAILMKAKLIPLRQEASKQRKRSAASRRRTAGRRRTGRKAA